MVSLEIGNHVLESMIDTGSEYTLIKENTTDYMGAKVVPTKNIPPLQGVTGKKLRVLGLIHTEVKINGDTLKVKMIVVPDHYLHCPVLLGMDILGRMNCTID